MPTASPSGRRLIFLKPALRAIVLEGLSGDGPGVPHHVRQRALQWVVAAEGLLEPDSREIQPPLGQVRPRRTMTSSLRVIVSTGEPVAAEISSIRSSGGTPSTRARRLRTPRRAPSSK